MNEQYSVNEQNIEIQTPDIDAVLSRPDTTENLPGVIVLTDGLGFRPEFAELSKRIAERGYVVLTPNIFYRHTKPPAYDPDLSDELEKKRYNELIEPLTPGAMVSDGVAYIDFLAAQPFVSPGPMGVVGFCFTGKFALRMAAARPDRIAAAASFHGGDLVKQNDPQSPHLVLPRVKARLYFGHAVNDDSMPESSIEILDKALKDWKALGGKGENETVDAQHGWMIRGRKVYDQQQAERGFAKLMALLGGTLRSPIVA